MSAVKMMEDVGARGLLRVGGLYFAVKVVDVRKVWARVDYLVEPIAGKPMAEWVSAERVKVEVREVAA